ncbi:hypothetical protein BO99DRAFT_140184 [Aspergillus violaceofuscus CBS 115571]|uniref:Uncharacterized protein n=1 Tax=Aspergillus violaceofuscus (strain CBS 115571) TaxID=1450538 RepID=A0A2V5HCH8_ASPV1|nr:hypothetical protein BO99DRAFT_140184 [Aspergillus violaceofuscus CBS 115571]
MLFADARVSDPRTHPRISHCTIGRCTRSRDDTGWLQMQAMNWERNGLRGETLASKWLKACSETWDRGEIVPELLQNFKRRPLTNRLERKVGSEWSRFRFHGKSKTCAGSEVWDRLGMMSGLGDVEICTSPLSYRLSPLMIVHQLVYPDPSQWRGARNQESRSEKVKFGQVGNSILQ